MKFAPLPALVALALAAQFGVAHADETKAAPAAPVAAPAASAAPAADAPIAVVNGVSIPAVYAELVKKEMAAQGRADNPQIDAQVRESLINLELLSKAAEAKGLDKDARMAAVMELRRKDQLAKVYLEDYVKSHPVTDEEVKAAYDKAKAGPAYTEFKAAHILVKTEAEAKKILAALAKNGASFAAIAKKASKDPGSAKNGGDLGWADPSAFVPEFSQSLVALKPGDYTKTPVKTQFGWHIIKLDNVRKGELAPLAEMKDEITKQLQQLRVREAVAAVREGAKVE